MIQASASHDGPTPVRDHAVGGAALANIVYRSRATAPLSALDLHRLTLAAQERNRCDSVTGLLLFDSTRFFQWLEGPADSLARVMRSICGDTRHHEIEILREQPVEFRRFSDWDMKLAVLGTELSSWPPDSITAPRDMVERLRSRPDDAPTLLVELVPVPAEHAQPTLQNFAQVAVDLRAASILDDVIRATVIPAIADQHGSAGASRQERHVSSRVEELAQLLIAPDPRAAFELIKRLRGRERLLMPMYASLVEPVARSLGDLWSEDCCSEFDVTLGLCRLQTAVRQLNAPPATSTPKHSRSRMPAVLIAPEPGEMHHLGAALDSEVLWQAGWKPQTAYPTSDQALQELVATSWFDALDLSLSAAFRREHWLPRITRTISLARLASRNPALAVVVGGRVFSEGHTGVDTGADVVSKTALHIDGSILQALRMIRNPV